MIKRNNTRRGEQFRMTCDEPGCRAYVWAMNITDLMFRAGRNGWHVLEHDPRNAGSNPRHFCTVHQQGHPITIHEKPIDKGASDPRMMGIVAGAGGLSKGSSSPAGAVVYVGDLAIGTIPFTDGMVVGQGGSVTIKPVSLQQVIDHLAPERKRVLKEKLQRGLQVMRMTIDLENDG